MTGSPWAVVLAGGDGDRVSAMTRDAAGGAVPKQYWCSDGRPPMVRWALARARSIAPAPRVLVAVKEQHQVFWQRHLADVPRYNILVQPENRGTAAGVLRALVEIQARGSVASPVVLLPSDHYVEDEGVLHHALTAAVQAARHEVPPVVLLGLSPAAPEPGYGWILPATSDAFTGVRQFVEKPPVESVGEMIRCGALINSFIVAARAQALLELFGRVLPEIVRAFRHAVCCTQTGLASRLLYEHLPCIDLSKDVLERAANVLSVLRVPPCGWTDLGTPDRLRQFLERPPRAPRALARAAHGTAAA
jgi:mannose-1-phosphate guanylyltransferase